MFTIPVGAPGNRIAVEARVGFQPTAQKLPLKEPVLESDLYRMSNPEQLESTTGVRAE